MKNRKAESKKSAAGSTAISAEAFDVKFDAGAEILEYLDVESAQVLEPGEPFVFPFSASPVSTHHPESPL